MSEDTRAEPDNPTIATLDIRLARVEITLTHINSNIEKVEERLKSQSSRIWGLIFTLFITFLGVLLSVAVAG